MMKKWIHNRTIIKNNTQELSIVHTPARKRYTSTSMASNPARQCSRFDLNKCLNISDFITKSQSTSKVVKHHEEQEEELLTTFNPRTDSVVELIKAPSLFDLHGKKIALDLKRDPSHEVINGMHRMHAHLLGDYNKKVDNLLTKVQADHNVLKKIGSYKSYEHPLASKAFLVLKQSNFSELKEIIHRNPELVHEVDSTLQTLLHWASRRNELAIVKMLISYGANIHAKDMAQRAPIDIAKHMHYTTIVTYLTKCETEKSSSPLYTKSKSKSSVYIWVFTHICMILLIINI